MKRLIVSSLVVLIVATGTFLLWGSLRVQSKWQVSQIAEAESYTTRSQLVRQANTLFSALRNVRRFWSTYGHLPRGQWESDAGIELSHFPGIELILWHDPKRGVRYARTAEENRLDYRPDDTAWQSYAQLLIRAEQSQGDALLGPFKEDGKTFYEVVIGQIGDREGGVLAAVLNVDTTLMSFLKDESPGYCIRVFHGETLLYQRGEPARDAPESWTRDGKIRLSFGDLWTVIHLPTEQMLDSFESPSIDLVLVMGLVIAVLFGTLTFENARARSRAIAAENAESELAEFNKGLEKIVQERTAELAERSADLQTMADSVAHDLRNPLNAIAVNSQLLEAQFAEPLGAEGRSILSRIPGCIRQMADILDRLFSLTSIANATFERRDVDIKQIISEVFEELTTADPEPEARLDIETLPKASADPTLVKILLMNLMDNALKFSRSREIREISLGAETEGDDTVFHISDNGVGFDSDSSEDIFGPFKRLSGTGKAAGTGLGLMLAKRVVSRHGGRIWARSTPGKGATFYFTLE